MHACMYICYSVYINLLLLLYFVVVVYHRVPGRGMRENLNLLLTILNLMLT